MSTGRCYKIHLPSPGDVCALFNRLNSFGRALDAEMKD